MVKRGEGEEKLEGSRQVPQGSLVSDPELGGAGEVLGPRHNGLWELHLMWSKGDKKSSV